MHLLYMFVLFVTVSIVFANIEGKSIVEELCWLKWISGIISCVTTLKGLHIY